MSRPSCLVYDLYLDTLGGGERVVFAVAEELARTHDVTVAGWRTPDPARLERFGLGRGIPVRRLHPARFPLATVGKDAVVYLANGVPLPSFARRSVLLLQFPFEPLSSKPVVRHLQRRALAGYEAVVYSEFVADWTKRRFGIEAAVAAPPAQLASPSPDPTAKQPCILAVGRFFDVEHAKRHDVLIEAYRQLPSAVQERWPLVLAGGVDHRPAGRAYLDRIRAQAAGANIRFELDVSSTDLRALLTSATLFWHATGFGRAADQPERAEHFGLSTLEAMSFGAVPLVYADGGQPEIVQPGCGVLWTTVDELVAGTVSLIEDDRARRAMAAAALERTRAFSPDALPQAVRERLQPARGG